MVDFNSFLRKLNKNRNILKEREAKYAGNAPLDLLNQIEDHERAITLTKQAIAGEITEAEWREALKPLLVAISERNSEVAGVTIGDVTGDIINSIITGGDVNVQNIHHHQTTFDQQGQSIQGDQYNAAGDINITVPEETPLWRRLSRLNIIASLVVGLVVLIVGSATFLEISLASLASPASAPNRMTGHINIVVAEPLVESPTDIDDRIKDFQAQYTEELSASLQAEFEPYGEFLELDQEIKVAAIPVEDISQRHEVVEAYAEDVGAHIVLYGVLDKKANYSPEFYIHPRFAAQGSELTGPDAIGKPIEIPFSGQGADQIAIKETLSKSLPHLSAFVGGLGLFQAGAYEKARESFERLVNEEWATEEGKAVLYLWLGTTHFTKAIQLQSKRRLPTTPVNCLVADREVSGGDAECARRSYEEATNIKEDFPRAYIGLGNYWLEFEKGKGCARFEQAISWYDRADEERNVLSGDDDRFAKIALVHQKILYHKGLTYARAFEEQCDDQYKEKSISTLAELVEYNDVTDEERESNSLLRDLTSRAYYIMGLVERWSGEDKEALKQLKRASEVALRDDEKDQPNLDPWQSIYWVARNQIGAIYVTQFENGDDPSFDLADNTLDEVTKAFDSLAFGHRHDDEPFVASAAWYHLGRLYGIKAERSGDELDLNVLGKAEEAYLQSIEVLKDTLENDPQLVYSQEDGLPWISHLNLGDIYRLWSTIDDRKAPLALAQYELVYDALESDERKFKADNEIRLDAYDRVYLGMGAIHLADKDFEKARKNLEEACPCDLPTSPIFQEANELLKQISDEATCEATCEGS